MNNNTRIKFGCYICNMCMSIVGNYSPILFVTFRELYGISYTLLGSLILINFTTQLIVDLIFTFFSHKFNIQRAVKAMPILTTIGLFLYAVLPVMFPQYAYIGLLIGTIIFSASSGFAEVLVSPVIAALPSDNTDREISILHSMYAWGVVFTVVIATLFLHFFGNENWYVLALILLIVPVSAIIMFWGTTFPKMVSPEKASNVLKLLKNKYLILCIACIFLGAGSELVMAQWSSGYFENALGLPKIVGDIFGVATFAVAMGIGRSLYGKIGKNIYRAMTFGAIGATICYLIVVVSDNPIISITACAITGFCVSMLWPGSVILASNEFPHGGVAIFALMAVGGDMGAAIIPQLVGVMADVAESSTALMSLADTLGYTSDQFALKLGMFISIPVPLIAIFVYLFSWRISKKHGKI